MVASNQPPSKLNIPTDHLEEPVDPDVAAAIKAAMERGDVVSEVGHTTGTGLLDAVGGGRNDGDPEDPLPAVRPQVTEPPTPAGNGSGPIPPQPSPATPAAAAANGGIAPATNGRATPAETKAAVTSIFKGLGRHFRKLSVVESAKGQFEYRLVLSTQIGKNAFKDKRFGFSQDDVEKFTFDNTPVPEMTWVIPDWVMRTVDPRVEQRTPESLTKLVRGEEKRAGLKNATARRSGKDYIIESIASDAQFNALFTDVDAVGALTDNHVIRFRTVKIPAAIVHTTLKDKIIAHIRASRAQNGAPPSANGSGALQPGNASGIIPAAAPPAAPAAAATAHVPAVLPLGEILAEIDALPEPAAADAAQPQIPSSPFAGQSQPMLDETWQRLRAEGKEVLTRLLPGAAIADKSMGEDDGVAHHRFVVTLAESAKTAAATALARIGFDQEQVDAAFRETGLVQYVIPLEKLNTLVPIPPSLKPALVKGVAQMPVSWDDEKLKKPAGIGAVQSVFGPGAIAVVRDGKAVVHHANLKLKRAVTVPGANGVAAAQKTEEYDPTALLSQKDVGGASSPEWRLTLPAKLVDDVLLAPQRQKAEKVPADAAPKAESTAQTDIPYSDGEMLRILRVGFQKSDDTKPYLDDENIPGVEKKPQFVITCYGDITNAQKRLADLGFPADKMDGVIFDDVRKGSVATRICIPKTVAEEAFPELIKKHPRETKISPAAIAASRSGVRPATPEH